MEHESIPKIFYVIKNPNGTYWNRELGKIIEVQDVFEAFKFKMKPLDDHGGRIMRIFVYEETAE